MPGAVAALRNAGQAADFREIEEPIGMEIVRLHIFAGRLYFKILEALTRCTP